MIPIDKPPRISPWILLGLILLLAAGLRCRVRVIGDSDEIQELLPGAQIDSIRLFPNTGNVLSIHWPDAAPNAHPLNAPSP